MQEMQILLQSTSRTPDDSQTHTYDDSTMRSTFD